MIYWDPILSIKARSDIKNNLSLDKPTYKMAALIMDEKYNIMLNLNAEIVIAGDKNDTFFEFFVHQY